MSQGSQDQPGENPDSTTDEGFSIAMTPLKPNCPLAEIVEALRHPTHGLSFITMPQTLPNYTFVAADAVSWLLKNMDGVTDIEKAVQILRSLHKDKFIRHASGDPTRQFVYGFYLFYILSDKSEKDDKDSFQPTGELANFENEFLEVEIKPALNWGLSNSMSSRNGSIPICGSERESCVPHFLCEEVDSEYAEADDDGLIYKKMRLETDVVSRSDRVEWGHARYQTVFRPDQAYELIAEWLTSSGSIVGELLFGWHRKGQTCGMQLIPIPHDPLALPYSNKSDPLRGPIFVPLNISCLDPHDHPFKDFPEDSWGERMFLFQEAIIQKFGFIKCLVEQPSNQNESREHQYIHATGTIFILISNTAPKRSRTNSMKEIRNQYTISKYSLHADVVPSPHEAYITRHVSGKNKADYDNSRKMGFLWCWNHMISRRWRTNQGVDSNFQIKCLKDFKAFCNNAEDRLRTFWGECWDMKALATTLK